MHTSSIVCYLCTPVYSALYPACLFPLFHLPSILYISTHPMAIAIRLSHATPPQQPIAPLSLHFTHWASYAVSPTGGVAVGRSQYPVRAPLSLSPRPLLSSHHALLRPLVAPLHFLRSALRSIPAPIAIASLTWITCAIRPRLDVSLATPEPAPLQCYLENALPLKFMLH